MATFENTVNSYTTGIQFQPAAARLVDGRLVFAWASEQQDGSSWETYFKLFTADTLPITGDIRANTTTTDSQLSPVVAALRDGGFVIIWESNLQDGSREGVFGQRFTTDGIKLGAEFQVNTTTTLDQTSPEVTALTDGGWVVTWADRGQEVVFQQRYDFLGIRVGTETQVNTVSTYSQTEPAITNLQDGGWVVTWASTHLGNHTGEDQEIFFKRFDASGNAVSRDTLVSTVSSTHDDIPDIVLLNNGDFAVTWAQNLLSDSEIFVRVYAPDGTPRGGIINAGDKAISPVASFPKIAALTDGGFAISWQDYDPPREVYFREFDADGTPRGDPVQAGPTVHPGGIFETDIVGLAGGGIGTVWTTGIYDIVATFHGRGTDRDDYVRLDNAQDFEARAGKDWIVGSEGNDTLRGGQQSDTLEGGAGDDVLLLGNGTVWEGFEIAYGGSGNDVLSDTNGLALLYGGLGDDLLRGGADDDTLFGEGGHDVLRGWTGDDSMVGGGGIDRLIAGDGDDTLRGGDGNDRLFGQNDNDILFGGRQADYLSGGAGDDLLNGGGGRDTLLGNVGDDTMTGGSAQDRFVFLARGFGNDVITDFQNGVDRITVADAVAVGFGNLTITDLGQNALVEMGGGSVLVMGGGGVMDASDFLF